MKGLLLIVSVLSLIAVGGWGVGFGLFYYNIKTAQQQQQQAWAQADAIVVLTGGSNRVNRGLDLLRDKLSDKLFISGVDSRVTVEKLISLWSGGDKAPGGVTLGREARNTAENAVEARTWAEKNKIKSMYLVTSTYHMPRALLIFKKVMTPGTEIFPRAVHAPDDDTFLPLCFEEYNKFLVTWVRIQAGMPL